MKHCVVLILFAAACIAPAAPAPFPEEGAVAPQAGSKPGAKAGSKGDGGGTSGGKAQAALGNVILNEVSCRGDEFVEVVNRGTTRVDLSGFSVADGDDPALAIPLFGMLNAGAHAAFPLNGLACDDDEAVLFDRGAVVDRIRAPLLPANASFARIPDGRGPFVLAGPTPRTDNASFIDDAARLFVALDEPVPMTLPQIRITLDATAEASLRGVTVESPRPWLEATVTFEDAQGMIVGPISTGLRLKGQSVFRDITGKAAFKLDFDRFKAGNHLLGIEKLTLNNFVQDATATRERVFYGLLARQGLPGPRVGYVEVLVNGRPFGVYLALESSDEAGFLGRSFPSSALLYEGEYGADLYVGKEANFDEDYGDDPTRMALAHVIEDFTAAGDASLVEDTQDTVAWDRVIPQMAADIFCGHFDSYTANSNNYTFHIDDEGRLSIISGGADQAFAQVVELDVNGGMLLERCLMAPGCTRSLNTAFATLSGEVDEWLADGGAARLRADAVRLATFFAADERTDWDQRQLAGLVDELIAFVQSQVRAF